VTNLSPHFTLEELTATRTRLANTPNQEQIESLKILCEKCLEPARAMVGRLRVNSGYRSPSVNRSVMGSPTSQHMNGQAADVVPLDCPLLNAFNVIKNSGIEYDQLILEPTWIHISWAWSPRRRVLYAKPIDGKIRYQEEPWTLK